MIALAGLPTAARADNSGTLGVVLLHGMLGVPLGSAPLRHQPPIGARLVASLQSAGYLVATPEMPWSHDRGFDRPFEESFGEIDAAVAGLKAEGATGIVVGGLSLGGNAAIAYAAIHPELLGVIGLAPAGDASRQTRLSAVRESVGKALRLASGGKGDERTDFGVTNTGWSGRYSVTLSTTPAIFLSFYGPDSQAKIAQNAARLAVPLLWVAGTLDPTQRGGPGWAFDQAPANPLNRYVTVNSSHLGTPDAAVDAVLSWLKAVTNR